ncbi:sugar ABC transporter ATP-binding protein [Variovorax sp. AFSI2.2]|uniref:sugar ABC transporter ATP-binding protein n=1 Tax=Variovorax sp. AFSI2.2 TaxID=3384160 RepID=UPI003EB94ED5
MPSIDSDESPFLSLSNVSIRFGGVVALRNVAFEVRRGEVHCLAGENGSGKSTLIKIVAGVYQPLDGASVRVDGQRHPQISPRLAQQLGIRVIWQDLALFPEMTVAENIAIGEFVGKRPGFVSHARMRDVARDALGRLGVELDLDRSLRNHPIAQRQIVAIARALIGEAKLIFMDEPTASLTQSETDYLLGIIRGLAASGVAVVFVSHRLAELLEIADRMTVLKDGELVGVFPTKGMTQSDVSRLMTGHPLQQLRTARRVPGGRAVLEVSGLTRRGEFEDISFTLAKGETLGITGLLGAGRTELALALFGMARPDKGAIRLDGVELNLRSNRDAIRSGIAYLSEDRLSLGLIQVQAIEDNLVLASLKKTVRGLFLSILRKRSAVSYWISRLHIKSGAFGNAISSLSGGNQQRVAIAKWLATDPRILILDSPTAGVDVGARAGIFEIVEELAQSGLAIILISDEVSEIHAHSDRVLHMAHGRLVGTYDPSTVSLKELEESIYA